MSDLPSRVFNELHGGAFSRDPSGSRAAILGIPFDCGTHPTRIGARQGPDAIRMQSSLVRPYYPPDFDFNPLELLNLVDCGNVSCVAGEVESALTMIETAVSEICQTGRCQSRWGVMDWSAFRSYGPSARCTTTLCWSISMPIPILIPAAAANE